MPNRRCGMCAWWRKIDIYDNAGQCLVPLPWWMDSGHTTKNTDGEDCETWKENVD